MTEVVQRNGTSGSWLGQLQTMTFANGTVKNMSGSFIFSVLGSSWAANMRHLDVPSQQYEIRPVSDVLLSLCLLDNALRYESREDEEVGTYPGAKGVFSDSMAGRSYNMPSRKSHMTLSSSTVDDDDILDVGVLWTPQAESLLGGQAGMLNLVNLAIDESNQICKNSLVNFRVRLSTARRIQNAAYVEPTSNTFVSVLFALTDQSDETFDVDTSTRSADGSDVTIMLIGGESSCGVAFQINEDGHDGSLAYGVVSFSCATGYYSFLHEIGHIMGANHDNSPSGK